MDLVRVKDVGQTLLAEFTNLEKTNGLNCVSLPTTLS